MGEKRNEGPWKAVKGTSTGMLVIAPNAPKIRRNVAAIGGPRREERALLIAAAPELLAALDWLLNLYDAGEPIGGEAITRARAARDKARGAP